MHRSATSLTTSVLVGCGWSAPGPSLQPNPANPRGFFEDREIHQLHKRVLAHYGSDWDSAGRLRELRSQPVDQRNLDAEDEAVRGVVENLRAGDAWVWKNPRATLFLDDWATRLPEAHFLICVRQPASVVASMLRRGNSLRLTGDARLARPRRLARAYSVWHSYNLLAYRFALAEPERVTIVRVPEDLPQLSAATTPSLVDPTMLRNEAPAEVRAAGAAAVASQLLYRRLRALHDPHRLRTLLDGPPGR